MPFLSRSTGASHQMYFTVEFLKKNTFDFVGEIGLIGTVYRAEGANGVDTFPRRPMGLQYCIRNFEQTPRTSSGKCYPLTVPFTTVNTQYTVQSLCTGVKIRRWADFLFGLEVS
jgi:hypothetical protein